MRAVLAPFSQPQLIPVSHSGGKDYLVLTEPLLERLEKQETHVQVIRVQKMDDGEHCDFFWCATLAA